MQCIYCIRFYFFFGGIGLIVLGIWLTIKEIETWSKWYNDKWTIGQIKGLGVAPAIERRVIRLSQK